MEKKDPTYRLLIHLPMWMKVKLKSRRRMGQTANGLIVYLLEHELSTDYKSLSLQKSRAKVQVKKAKEKEEVSK